MIKPSKVIFADKKLEKAYFRLEDSDPLKKAIKAIEKIKQKCLFRRAHSKKIDSKTLYSEI